MWQKLNHLDRRWIFLAMLVAVILPMLAGFTSPAGPSPETAAVFDQIEHLPAGSRIALVLDYEPASEAELHPMAIALVRHCCLKRHKMIFLTLWPAALPVIDRIVQQVIEKEFGDHHLKYGEDYVLLGYQPGEQVAIPLLTKDLRASKPRDDRGTSLDSIELTKHVRGLKDLDLLVSVSAGYPGSKEWVQYCAATSRLPMVAGSVGVQVPNLLPYLATPTSPGPLIGLIKALRGAVEYETLLTTTYPEEVPANKNIGQRRMGPQLWAHLLIVALITFGNVLQWKMRRAGGTA